MADSIATSTSVSASTSLTASTTTSVSAQAGTAASAATAPEKMKTIYQPFSIPQADGQYFTALIAPGDYTPDYPYIDTPIPDELQDKVVKWDRQLRKWVDSMDDPVAAEINGFKAQNASLIATLATTTENLQAAQKSADTANTAVAALIAKMATDEAAGANK